jgi:hypothetical protein
MRNLPFRSDLLLFAGPVFHPIHDLAQGYPKRVCDLPETADCGIKDSAFDPTNVCAVETALGAEPFLRVPGTFPELAQRDSDCSFLEIRRLKLFAAPLHA